MRRHLRVAIVAIAVLPLLSGCVFFPNVLPPAPANERPAADGPEGWTEFPSCPNGPRDEWVWIDGFPAEELDAAAIEPQCADTWIEDDGDHFVGVVASGVAFEQFDVLNGAMVAAGWDVTYDDLQPTPQDGAEVGLVGWRDYELDGGDTLFVIEVYFDGEALGYTVYADLHSPATRELAS
jgi:hypothetical protein